MLSAYWSSLIARLRQWRPLAGFRSAHPRYRAMTKEETLRLCPADQLELRHLVREAYLRGDVCVGAFQRGKLMAYAWVDQDLFDRDDVRALGRPAAQAICDKPFASPPALQQPQA